MHVPPAQEHDVVADSLTVAPAGRLRDVLSLGKPRLSSLVVSTAAAGLVLAPGRLAWHWGLAAVASIAALVMGANALNCLLERQVDAAMHRTQNRPLVTGRVTAGQAVWFGLGSGVAGLMGLAIAANPLTAALGAVAFISYVWVYTPLKSRSTTALFVGAVPGALPPLMGWTAASGRIDAMGMALFGLLFFWQLPHFLAIAVYLQQDYARGGLRVFSLVHGRAATKWAILISSVLLVGVSLAPLALGYAGWPYAAVALVLGGLQLGGAASGFRARRTPQWARRMLLFTLAYLPLLLLALVVGGR